MLMSNGAKKGLLARMPIGRTGLSAPWSQCYLESFSLALDGEDSIDSYESRRLTIKNLNSRWKPYYQV